MSSLLATLLLDKPAMSALVLATVKHQLPFMVHRRILQQHVRVGVHGLLQIVHVGLATRLAVSKSDVKPAILREFRYLTLKRWNLLRKHWYSCLCSWSSPSCWRPGRGWADSLQLVELTCRAQARTRGHHVVHAIVNQKLVHSWINWYNHELIAKSLLEQGLRDSEEFVIHRTLNTLSKMVEIGLLNLQQIFYFLKSHITALLCHPPLLIRHGAVNFVTMVCIQKVNLTSAIRDR